VIRPPRRSVTRFFIPLMDVLILLFCIFLLMPYVKPVEGEAPDAATATRPGFAQTVTPPGNQSDNVTELNRTIERLQHERDRLLEQRGQVLKQLAIRVLEIDPGNGRLYYYDPERVEVVNQAEAQALIDRERRRVGGRELYFLILFPRGPSGYPLQGQYEAYEKWFHDVPHAFDSPSGRPTEY
jgi:hypothetical protein